MIFVGDALDVVKQVCPDVFVIQVVYFSPDTALLDSKIASEANKYFFIINPLYIFNYSESNLTLKLAVHPIVKYIVDSGAMKPQVYDFFWTEIVTYSPITSQF